MNLREIHVTDAEAYIQLLSKIEEESPYALLVSGERTTSIREQMDEINTILASSNQTIFIAEDGAELVGWCGAFGEKYQRVRHTILIGIGILKAYTGKGIGTRFFEILEKWAWDHGIRRMELLVQTGNKAGIALYRKMGFQIEGTKRESYQIEGEYLNEYLMAKILKHPEPIEHNPFPRW